MKKLVKVALMCCAAVVCGFTMVGCNPEVTGDMLYDVTVANDTGYLSYKSYAESTILDAVRATGAIQTDAENTYFMLNGSPKDCDKKISAAVAKAMDSIEAREDYNTTLFKIDGVTVVVERAIRESQTKIVFSRKFKAQKSN